MLQLMQMSLDVQNQVLLQGREMKDLMRENIKVMKKMSKYMNQIQGKVSFIENRHMKHLLE